MHICASNCLLTFNDNLPPCMPDVWRMPYSLHVKDRMYMHAWCLENAIFPAYPVFYMQGVWHSPNIRHACTSCLLHAGSMAFSKHQACVYILSFTCREYGILQDRMYMHAWCLENAILPACKRQDVHACLMFGECHIPCKACMYILSFTCREYGILQTSGMCVHPVFYMQGVWHSPNIRHACTSCL
jgi:hypothetical protein